ncbi:MAG: hypothetical protein CXZ00_05160 [Acidobacteria bacterium]|nr:MAG: hypothetical protein CXZ00_05160 [Acidobacteriota bacterium]
MADTYNRRIRKVTAGGVISTVAGTGTLGYSGDGGPAISAELSQPVDVAVDSSGNLYVLDGNRVRVVGENLIPSAISISASQTSVP